MKDYHDFLASKQLAAKPSGFTVNRDQLNPSLFPFQADIVQWALKLGRAAIFADCGLGKTLMQLEWARQVAEKTGGIVLILTPLAVAQQTAKEAERFGIKAAVVSSHYEIDALVKEGYGIFVTNYQKLHHFDPKCFSGIVLDESSILKGFDRSTCQGLIEAFENTPHKLACTATPSPNDYMELGTHAEFLGVMKRSEMLSMFFVHDSSETSKWRLKGHAEEAFWRWVSSWACMIRKPSDLGYSDEGFELPPLEFKYHWVDAPAPDGYLFATAPMSIHERRHVRRSSLSSRVKVCAELVNRDMMEPWLVWCDLNEEGTQLDKEIPLAEEVAGRHTDAQKEAAMSAFSRTVVPVLISKPSICGFGMNWQHCSNVAFVGLSDSYESFYQAIRRCWRFGQKKPVTVHIIASEAEEAVVENIKRKERQHQEMVAGMVKQVGLTSDVVRRVQGDGIGPVERGESWTAYNGDCVECVGLLQPDSVGYSIFSPPFSSLYSYSNSDRDMGNSADDGEFFQHFGYLVKELFRVLKPGRNVSVHCMNLPSTIAHNGYIGIRDFRGDIIRLFGDAGFIYHSEVCIWKDPVTAMQRTKALGLLYKQLKKDSCMSRQGIPDYLCTFRKPGANAEPVFKRPEEFPVSQWQNYASPVWMDIDQTETLSRTEARDEKDEKHICPLQLGVIRRGVQLWSNPGDLVLSPFMGIGSEGHVSVGMGRRFVGVELKRSYFDQAVKNLRAAEDEAKQPKLFSEAA